MSIRPMTNGEIVKALRRAAVVCLEKGRCDWHTLDVCRADGTYYAAAAFLVESELFAECDPGHAAHYLLFVAEATNA